MSFVFLEATPEAILWECFKQLRHLLHTLTEVSRMLNGRGMSKTRLWGYSLLLQTTSS
jgi:hypothetical protein